MAPRLQVYGCYLLRSLNEHFRGSTYIGFTVDPAKRIRQHNGELAAGALKTRLRRPWEMATLIMGFPNKVSALQFEWAWQHPRESRILRDHTKGFWHQKGVVPKISILHIMLGLEPWKSLPLQLHYTSPDYKMVAESSTVPPPPHLFSSATVGPLSELWMYKEAERLLRLAREYRRRRKKVGNGTGNGADISDDCADIPDETVLLRDIRGKSVRRMLQSATRSSSAPSQSKDHSIDSSDFFNEADDVDIQYLHPSLTVSNGNPDIVEALNFAKRSCGVDILRHNHSQYWRESGPDIIDLSDKNSNLRKNRTHSKYEEQDQIAPVVGSDSGSDLDSGGLQIEGHVVGRIGSNSSESFAASMDAYMDDIFDTGFDIDPNIEARLDLSAPVLDLTLDEPCEEEATFVNRAKGRHTERHSASPSKALSNSICPWCTHIVKGSKSALTCPVCGQMGHLLCWSGYALRSEESPLSEIKLVPNPDTRLSCPRGYCNHRSSWREFLESNGSEVVDVEPLEVDPTTGRRLMSDALK